MQLKNNLALDVTNLQKEDTNRVLRVENYERNFSDLIES